MLTDKCSMESVTMRDFKYIGQRINELLNSCENDLTAKEVEDVQHFLNVDEYGLALETFIAALAGGDKQVDQKVFQICVELAKRMEMPAETWKPLQKGEPDSQISE